MYRAKEKVLERLMKTALEELIDEELASAPSDEELAKRYPSDGKRIKRYIRRSKAKRYSVPMPLVYARRVAVVFLVMATTAFSLLITDSGVRAAMTDSVLTWTEKTFGFEFEWRRAKHIYDYRDSIFDFEIGYMPDEYVYCNTIEWDTYRSENYEHKEKNTVFDIRIAPSDSPDLKLLEYFYENKEMASNLSEITINGAHGVIYYNEEEQYGMIYFGDDHYRFNVGGAAPKEELIKVAENIK